MVDNKAAKQSEGEVIRGKDFGVDEEANSYYSQDHEGKSKVLQRKP